MALEHDIGDDAVAVQIHGLIVRQQVLADELALHVASLGGVGAHEGALVIAVHHVVGDLAVEEDDGNAGVLGGVHSVLGGVRGGRLHDVDDQQVGAIGQRGVDLVGLLGLVAGAVKVVVVDAQGGQHLVHIVADAGDVHVGVVVVEHGHVQLTGLSGLALRRSRGGGGGRGAAAGAAAGAAGEGGKHENGCKNKSKFLLHRFSS